MIQKLQFQNDIDCDGRDDLLEHDAPGLDFSARWIEAAEELEALVPRWQRLGKMAIRENLFFDPSFLIPAFRHLNPRGARTLIIEATSIADPPGTPVLCGLLPLTQKPFYHIPLKCYEIWRHEQCFDATPLIRKDCAFDVLQFALEFLSQDGARLLSMDMVSADSGFADLLEDVVQDQHRSVFQRDQFSRAAFRPRATVQEFITNNVSKTVRKNVGRLERRLREQGDLQVTVSNQESDFASLAQQFLELEASGWKGETGTALACSTATQTFFQEMVSRSADANRVSFLNLELDGRPIAMLCDLYADGFGCSYKTAFDASYSRFSPGLIVEIKNIEHMHAAKIVNMDSCTDSDNATINRIWKDRMKFQSVVIPLDRGISNWAISIMPWMQTGARVARQLSKKFSARRSSDPT